MILKLVLPIAAICAAIVHAQPQPKIVVKLVPSDAVTAKAGQAVVVKIVAVVDPGFHVNSDKPGDPYIIPLNLTWAEGALEKPTVAYPKPETIKLPFAEKPVAVYSGEFSVTTQFKVASRATQGSTTLSGKLRYQACNDHECLIPRTVDITIPVEIAK